LNLSLLLLTLISAWVTWF